MDKYLDRCPKCNGILEVISFEFWGKIPLSKSGFSAMDAIEFNTQNEVVACLWCDYKFNGLPTAEDN